MVIYKEKLYPEISNCEIENIGTNENPIFSCKTCNNQSNILIKTESNRYFCSEPSGELEGCTEAKADTYYLNTIYNCKQCSGFYTLYYSEFYKRNLCIGRFGEIKRKKELSKNAYEGVENDTTIENGKCHIKEAFTPYGTYCYKCDNKYVGMPGCLGSCSYSENRANIIECEGRCKSGYIETSKGVCEFCNETNLGCISCYYDSAYYEGYTGFKRKRRFVCDDCEDGFLLGKDGICHHCSELGFTYCESCHEDKNEFECIKCIDGFFLSNNGKCIKCEDNKVQSINNNCVYCNDTDEGGIEGCEKCTSDNGKITCFKCREGFTLNEDIQKCMKISKNKEIEHFPNCERVSQDNNNNYYCTKCFENYNLLRDNNESRCVNNNFIVTPKSDILNLCKDSNNLGTEDKPRHSCNKCVENNILSQQQRENGITITKIKYSENETSFCSISELSKGILKNCTEATRYTNEEGEEIFNCTKCAENNKFIYHADQNITICQYFHYDRRCMVKNCRTCKGGNNYFCSQCLLENYEVNSVTGSCVKKMEKTPAISWKDFYRLILNDVIDINSQKIYGPSLFIRGISNDDISPGHSFLVKLVFLIKYTRNLQENSNNITIEKTAEKKYDGICTIIEGNNEKSGSLGLVDYKCIGNRTGEDDLKESQISLKTVEGDNDRNDSFLKNSNFEQIAKTKNFEDIINQNYSTFTIKMFDDVLNQIS